MGHCGCGEEACSRRTQRGGGGVQRRRGGNATRLREPTTVTRPQNTLPRARSGPISLTLAGRPGSLRGQRGREQRDAGPRQRQTQLGDHNSGEEATMTQRRWTQFPTLAAGPDVLLRQQRPYGSTSQERARPLLFAPPPSSFHRCERRVSIHLPEILRIRLSQSLPLIPWRCLKQGARLLCKEKPSY